MLSFIKEFGECPKEIFQPLRTLVTSSTKPFQPSKLYAIDTKTKFVDEGRRSSVFRLFEPDSDPEVFDLAKAVAIHLSTLDPLSSYQVIRNDVSHIVYGDGDFFEPHQDYLSWTTNVLEEHTLIICLDATCDDGETVFHLNPFFTHVSRSSVTPGHLLAFRKDVTHEGRPLKGGKKEILTLNLVVYPKTTPYSVIIACRREKASIVVSLQALGAFPDCLIMCKLKFDKLVEKDRETGGWKAKEKIVRLTLDCLTPTLLPIVEKIVRRAYLSPLQVSHHKDELEFLGFQASDLMIDLASGPVTTVSFGSLAVKELDDDLVFCASKAELDVLNKRIRQEGLPFVSFSLVLAEGTWASIGPCGDGVTNYPMHVIYASFCEAQHLLFTRGCQGDSAVPNGGESYHVKTCYPCRVGLSRGKAGEDDDLRVDLGSVHWGPYGLAIERRHGDPIRVVDFKPPSSSSESGEDLSTEEEDSLSADEKKDDIGAESRTLEWEIEHCYDDPCVYFGLQIFPQNASYDAAQHFVTALDTEVQGSRYPIYPSDCIAPCNGLHPSDKEGPFYATFAPDGGDVSFMYLKHRHQKILKDYLKDSDFFKRILANINRIGIVFPQQQGGTNGSLCNEQAYSNFSLVEIHGAIKFTEV